MQSLRLILEENKFYLLASYRNKNLRWTTTLLIFPPKKKKNVRAEAHPLQSTKCEPKILQ